MYNANIRSLINMLKCHFSTTFGHNKLYIFLISSNLKKLISLFLSLFIKIFKTAKSREKETEQDKKHT